MKAENSPLFLLETLHSKFKPKYLNSFKEQEVQGFSPQISVRMKEDLSYEGYQMQQIQEIQTQQPQTENKQQKQKSELKKIMEMGMILMDQNDDLYAKIKEVTELLRQQKNKKQKYLLQIKENRETIQHLSQDFHNKTQQNNPFMNEDQLIQHKSLELSSTINTTARINQEDFMEGLWRKEIISTESGNTFEFYQKNNSNQYRKLASVRNAFQKKLTINESPIPTRQRRPSTKILSIKHNQLHQKQRQKLIIDLKLKDRKIIKLSNSKNMQETWK